MSKKKKKPLMAMISSAYFKIHTKNFLTFRRGAAGKHNYACRKYPGYVSVFGWEGDKDAPIAFIDGSYLLRDRKNTLITFGLSDVEGKIEWFNKEGWLPCLVANTAQADLIARLRALRIFLKKAKTSSRLPIRE